MCPRSCFSCVWASGGVKGDPHPVRSAGKTTAAAPLPSLWELQAVAALHSGRVPSLLPAPPPRSASLLLLSLLQPRACPNCCLSTQTSCQQKHTVVVPPPAPAVNTLPRAVCHSQSRAQALFLPGSCQHSCSPLLGPQLSFTHVTRVLRRAFSVCMRTRGRGSRLGTRLAHALPSDLACQFRILLWCDLGQLT